MEETTTQPKRRKSRKKPKVGRPHQCLPQVIDDICQALALSASSRDAAEYAGQSQAAYFKWLARAKRALDAVDLDYTSLPDKAHKLVKKGEAPFVELLQRSQKAKARGNVGLLATAHQAARGGWVTHPDTGKTLYIRPDGRTALKLLAVRNPKDYAETQRHELSGPEGEDFTIQLCWPEETRKLRDDREIDAELVDSTVDVPMLEGTG